MSNELYIVMSRSIRNFNILPFGIPRVFELFEIAFGQIFGHCEILLVKFPAMWKDLSSIVPAPGIRKNELVQIFSFNSIVVICSLTR